MCTLHERIQELCKSKGVSGSRMCLDLGMSKSTLSDLKSGRKKGLNAETAHKIATYLNVSVGYLLGEEGEKMPTAQGDGLTESQRKLMDFAKSVPDDKAEMILRVMKSIVEAD